MRGGFHAASRGRKSGGGRSKAGDSDPERSVSIMVVTGASQVPGKWMVNQVVLLPQLGLL